MSIDGTQSREELIEAHLRGTLPESARAEFERQLAADAQLRADVERQRALDQAIERLFPEPSPEAMLRRLNVRVPEAEPVKLAPPASRRRRPLWLRTEFALAACVALALLAAFWLNRGIEEPASPYDTGPRRTLVEVYHDTRKSGFKPAWVCSNDEEFADTTARQFGQPMLLASVPSNLEVIGWAYSNSITPDTMQLLARVNGREAMVFVDEAAEDSGPVSEDRALNLFRRELGKLVLYELTPLDRPALLDRFYIPTPASAPSSTASAP